MTHKQFIKNNILFCLSLLSFCITFSSESEDGSGSYSSGSSCGFLEEVCDEETLLLLAKRDLRMQVKEIGRLQKEIEVDAAAGLPTDMKKNRIKLFQYEAGITIAYLHESDETFREEEFFGPSKGIVIMSYETAFSLQMKLVDIDDHCCNEADSFARKFNYIIGVPEDAKSEGYSSEEEDHEPAKWEEFGFDDDESSDDLGIRGHERRLSEKTKGWINSVIFTSDE